MSKATNPSTQHLSVEQAAAAIVALINSSPRTPRQAEIAAIIERTKGADNTGDSAQKATQWRRALAEWHATYEDPDYTDEAVRPLLNAASALTQEIWAQGAKTWNDVKLFAELTRFWAYDDAYEPVVDGDYEEALKPTATTADQSVAQLVKAVLGMNHD